MHYPLLLSVLRPLSENISPFRVIYNSQVHTSEGINIYVDNKPYVPKNYTNF